MKDNTVFEVGQFVKYNRITTSVYNDGRGVPLSLQSKDEVIGKIVALHENNKRRIEVEDRKTKKHYRVVPRNIISIIPKNCIPLTWEEQLAKEFGMFQFNIGQVKYLSNYGKDELMKHLTAINEIFASPLINSYLTGN